MKRFFAIGLVLIICFFEFFYITDIFKVNKESYEFKAFQKVLDESFFPVLNDAFKHLDQAADELEDNTFLDWYLTLDGLTENEEYQAKIEETEKKILEEDVKGIKTIHLKKNILQQIIVLEETFELLHNAATDQTGEKNLKLLDSFTANIEELTELSEQMNGIFEENIEKALSRNR